MNHAALTEIGRKYVERIQKAFDDKRLNDTGAARSSISFTVKGNKLIIEGLARSLFLEFGRRAGSAPPFKVIRDWAERKLDLPEDELDGISWAIVNKIKKHGTNILTDRTKGLQMELILKGLNDELSKLILNFEAKRIVNGLIKTWTTNQTP